MEGLRIGVTAARKGTQLATTLRRRGALVLHGPTTGGDRPAPDEQILAATDAMTAARPAWLAASTGVGMRLWADTLERHGRRQALHDMLAGAASVARGVKAEGALRALGVQARWVSRRQTDADVASWLASRVLPGDVVAVQSHGSPTSAFDVLRDEVQLLTVLPYRCVLPDDQSPARRLIHATLARELDVVTFTSAGAARNLVTLASTAGLSAAQLLEALRSDVAVAAVGHVTAAVFEELGVPVAITPLRPHTGELVRSVEAWAARRRSLGSGPRQSVRFDPTASTVEIHQEIVRLGTREYAVLAALARRPGVVCSHRQLIDESWGHEAPADARAVKHQVARLRRKLAGTGIAIETVRGVGYRFTVRPGQLS